MKIKKKINSSKKINKLESLIIFKCNCNCIMCSVGMMINRSSEEDYSINKSFSDVVKDINKAKDLGVQIFAISGGEPTLRKDLLDIVKYAKSVGIPEIEIQSNGRMYFYKEYCQELINAGVNIFVISLHSHKSDIHDKMMGVPGTYQQVIQGIKNLNELGQIPKINLVLSMFNYKYVEDFIKFLINNFKIQEIRFIMGMVEGNALKAPKKIIAKMSSVSPYLCKAISLADKSGIGCYVYNMVPCLMPGFEKYVNDLLNVSSDTILSGPEFEINLDNARKKKKIKIKTCEECKYNNVCYGLWRSYANVFGLSELKPIK